MEAAIRWSLNSNLSEQRFLLADGTGRTFSPGKVASYDGKTLKYNLLPACRKVPPFRVFDWSPFDENLVAVGQWSGEATILRLDDGAAPISLPTKHQRLCNAVAFSRAGLLATGLERVRNVECLNLWDVNQRLSSIPSPGGRGGKSVEPFRKYSSSEAISSIKFSNSHPEVLIAGVKGVGIRIYDLRQNVGNASLQFHTSRVYNVATDILNENHFACCGTGKDTTIQIWDSRTGSPQTTMGSGAGSDHSNQARPVLEYPEAFTTTKDTSPVTIWSLRFCKGKEGILGALASNGEFKVFETTHGYSFMSESHGSQGASTPLAERSSTKRVQSIERAWNDVHQTRQERERIVSFDFTNLAGSKGTPTAIILRGNGGISIQELSGLPIAFGLSPSANLSVSTLGQAVNPSKTGGSKVGLYDGVVTYVPKKESPITALTYDVETKLGLEAKALDSRSTKGSSILGKGPLSSREAHERTVSVRLANTTMAMDAALGALTLTQQRCAAGYSLDPEKNMQIVADDTWLQSLWSWIKKAQSTAGDGGMSAAGFDMSYLGVFDIWRCDVSPDQIHRRTDEANADVDFSDAVTTLATSLDPTFLDQATDFPEHRRVCLHTCSLGLSTAEVEDTVEELLASGEKIKAAALAVRHNEGKLALKALRAGTVSGGERELSLALASYLNGLTEAKDNVWRETIQDLATNLNDPYARAILALVSHGDWHDVLKETSLPLRDRVGIALVYLSDDELSQYINNTTTEAINAGDIEGIVLTGLGPKSVPLFANYIRKFSDLQTAVLALSFASPRYFTDHRVTAWRQTYRSQLDQLGMFLKRAHYDVRLTKLSTLPNGQCTLPPPPRQVSLHCGFCEQCLDQNPDHSSASVNTGTNHGTHRGSIFGLAGKSGTACPKCGRHMPRCAVCLHWVGMPDPHTKGAVAKKMGKEEAMAKFVNVCLKCWHVTHAGHAEEWFQEHKICPASGCDCRCTEIDLGTR